MLSSSYNYLGIQRGPISYTWSKLERMLTPHESFAKKVYVMPIAVWAKPFQNRCNRTIGIVIVSEIRDSGRRILIPSSRELLVDRWPVPPRSLVHIHCAFGHPLLNTHGDPGNLGYQYRITFHLWRRSLQADVVITEPPHSYLNQSLW